MRKVRLDGKKIKELREGLDRGARQKEFAHGVQISERQLRYTENDNVEIAAEVAERIARRLGTTVEALLLNEESVGSEMSASTADANRTPEKADNLIALGPDIIFGGELVSVGSDEWTVGVDEFIAGDISSLVAFIGRFAASPPYDRYILVNAVGDGRTLSGVPVLTKGENGHLIRCPVAARFPRTDARHLGSQMALSPTTNDVFAEHGNIARVAGLDALPQMVRTCLSMQRGESPFYRDCGARLAEYFHRFRNSPRRNEILKLEVIRQSAIAYKNAMSGRSDTPLQCVERVWSIEPLAEAPENRWLPCRVVFEVSGLGRWQHDVPVCVPDADTLEQIRDRQRTLAAVFSGVRVTRDELNSVMAADRP